MKLAVLFIWLSVCHGDSREFYVICTLNDVIDDTAGTSAQGAGQGLQHDKIFGSSLATILSADHALVPVVAR